MERKIEILYTQLLAQLSTVSLVKNQVNCISYQQGHGLEIVIQDTKPLVLRQSVREQRQACWPRNPKFAICYFDQGSERGHRYKPMRLAH